MNNMINLIHGDYNIELNKIDDNSIHLTNESSWVIGAIMMIVNIQLKK